MPCALYRPCLYELLFTQSTSRPQHPEQSRPVMLHPTGQGPHLDLVVSGHIQLREVHDVLTQLVKVKVLERQHLLLRILCWGGQVERTQPLLLGRELRPLEHWLLSWLLGHCRQCARDAGQVLLVLLLQLQAVERHACCMELLQRSILLLQRRACCNWQLLQDCCCRLLLLVYCLQRLCWHGASCCSSWLLCFIIVVILSCNPPLTIRCRCRCRS